MTRLLTAIRILFSRVVFALKCRAGFRLLQSVEGIEGIVTAVEMSSDGDACFDLDLATDPGSRALLVWGTAGAAHISRDLHCEIAPVDHARLLVPISHLARGVRVRVGGRRAWDGCHHNRGVIFDVLMVLLGAAPVVDGWIEIHPVESLEILP